jgi:asparagine synthase (glutamine-hydrolysing)
MCGIAGLVTRGRVDEARLCAMAEALAHRGPDGEGRFVSSPFAAAGDEWQLGLAHRRLAVFDPSPAGAQPMRSRSGRTVLVLNGEIYNHAELRRHLPGFPFRSGTDTEVLLELCEEIGVRAALERANGMFALAFWDAEIRSLVLGRDRVGIKPLFYRESGGAVAFASELRGLLVASAERPRIDPRGLSEYLDFGFVGAPRTVLEGFAKLPPGSLLEWRDGRCAVSPWWTLPEAASHAGPAPGWREGLHQRLSNAVHLQLRADVPVGAFLSGGVDSTLVTTLAVRERGAIDTFSVRFPESPRLDEGAHAAAVARLLGTRHHEVSIGADDAERIAVDLLAEVDEPFADSSLLPVHVLSKAAREHVTVALSGDGADELFAGYRRYQADRWLIRWRRVPGPFRARVAERLLRRLGDDRATARGELVRRARKVLASASLAPDARALALARIFGAAEKLAVAPGLADVEGAGLERLQALRATAGGRDELDTRLRVDLVHALPDDMLVKVDRASMAHGLEVRVPFLDHRVVEHAALLPSRLKLRGTRGKRALLDVFGADLPAHVRRRPKAGFDAPIGAWLRGPLRTLTRDVLAAPALASAGWLDPGAVSRLLDDHDAGRADHAWRLWSLVVLQTWLARWAPGPARAGTAALRPAA